MQAFVDFPSAYTSQKVERALKTKLPSCQVVHKVEDFDTVSSSKQLQWCDYDEINFDVLMSPSGFENQVACSYMIRKALTRKHHLPVTMHQYLVKHPESKLPSALPKTFSFELSYPEDLDELWYDELYELGQSMDSHPGQFWMLKAGMADKGQSIRLFSTQEELEAIVQDFADASDDEEESDAAGAAVEDAPTTSSKPDTKVSLSQMRMWIIQKYVEDPLLVSLRPGQPGRKFHLRVYVLCVGALQVYVYDQMLALFAPEAYDFPPKGGQDESGIYDLTSHLTNTCLQESDLQSPSADNENVQRLQDLIGKATSIGRVLTQSDVESIIASLSATVGEVFKAAVSSGSHFQPLPNAFEIYGLDFLVDESLNPLLLEVNGGPDFAQTGHRLESLIQTLFDGTVDLAVKPLLGQSPEQDNSQSDSSATKHFRQCLDVQVRSGW